MKKRYKVYYKKDFTRKIDQICDYILYELQNPIASYKFRIKLLQTLSILDYLPEAGPMYRNTQYHYIVMKHWLILYKIQDNYVKIYKIISSKQDLDNQFLD